MAPSVARGKSKESTSYRLLFRNLEKARKNSKEQDQALMELSLSLMREPKACHEAALRQTLDRTVRWYENNRKYLDKAILQRGLHVLNEVFIQYEYSSLAEGPSKVKEEMEVIEKARALCNKEQDTRALALLKPLEAKVEKSLATSDTSDFRYTSIDWVADFLGCRGKCYDHLSMWHLAIEDYTQFLARISKELDNQLSMNHDNIINLVKSRRIMINTQRCRGHCYYNVGYYAEAKSDMKYFLKLKKPPTPFNDLFLTQLNCLYNSYLKLKRYKHALLAAYQLRFYTKKLNMPILHSWSATMSLAQCLYKNKKFPEANWLLSDLILECQDDKIKIAAFELNGHCLMEMNKYKEAMKNLKQANVLNTDTNGSKLLNKRIHIAMYKYASDAQDKAYCKVLQMVTLPWVSYDPIYWIEHGSFETETIKCVIEKSIQVVKPYNCSEKAQNHLMFCNSIMITKMFKK